MRHPSADNQTSTPWYFTGSFIWLLISTFLGLLSLLPWTILLATSFMAFDSGESPQAYAFVGAVLSYPLLPVGCGILAWLLFAFKKRRAAVIVTSLPLLAVLLVGCIFGVFMLPSLVP